MRVFVCVNVCLCVHVCVCVSDVPTMGVSLHNRIHRIIIAVQFMLQGFTILICFCQFNWTFTLYTNSVLLHIMIIILYKLYVYCSVAPQLGTRSRLKTCFTQKTCFTLSISLSCCSWLSGRFPGSAWVGLDSLGSQFGVLQIYSSTSFCEPGESGQSGVCPVVPAGGRRLTAILCNHSESLALCLYVCSCAAFERVLLSTCALLSV